MVWEPVTFLHRIYPGLPPSALHGSHLSTYLLNYYCASTACRPQSDLQKRACGRETLARKPSSTKQGLESINRSEASPRYEIRMRGTAKCKLQSNESPLLKTKCNKWKETSQEEQNKSQHIGIHPRSKVQHPDEACGWGHQEEPPGPVPRAALKTAGSGWCLTPTWHDTVGGAVGPCVGVTERWVKTGHCETKGGGDSTVSFRQSFPKRNRRCSFEQVFLFGFQFHVYSRRGWWKNWRHDSFLRVLLHLTLRCDPRWLALGPALGEGAGPF